MRNTLTSIIAAVAVIAAWEAVRPAPAAAVSHLSRESLRTIAEYAKGQSIVEPGSGGGGCQAGVNCSALSFTASAGSSDTGFALKQGARLCLNEPTCDRWLTYDGSNVLVNGSVVLAGANSVTAYGFGYGTARVGVFGVAADAASGTLANVILYRGSGTADANMNKFGVIYTGSSSGGTTRWGVTAVGGGVQMEGIATASLPTCNSDGINTAGGTKGRFYYDTTANTIVFCNGTAWKTLAEVP